MDHKIPIPQHTYIVPYVADAQSVGECLSSLETMSKSLVLKVPAVTQRTADQRKRCGILLNIESVPYWKKKKKNDKLTKAKKLHRIQLLKYHQCTEIAIRLKYFK